VLELNTFSEFIGPSYETAQNANDTQPVTALWFAFAAGSKLTCATIAIFANINNNNRRCLNQLWPVQKT